MQVIKSIFGGLWMLCSVIIITKTRLHNFDPLKAHFYIVELAFTRVYIIFLFQLKNTDYGYSLEPPRQGVLTSTYIYVLSRNMKNIRIFLSENFHVLSVKFSVYLNRHLFIMWPCQGKVKSYLFFAWMRVQAGD